MTDLNLAGYSAVLGAPVRVMLDPTHPTLGQIVEEVNGTPGVLDVAPFGNGGCGTSFFDVFALFKVGVGTSMRVYHTAVPLRIVARICHKPPLRSEERRVGKEGRS